VRISKVTMELILKEPRIAEHVSEFFKDCLTQLQERLMEWSFIPPSALHLGGLCEAGIKNLSNIIRIE